MSWPVYIISLPQDIARRKSAEKQLKSHGVQYEIIHGVYGKNLLDGQIQRVYKQVWWKFPRQLTYSEVGCYLSHLKIWQSIIDNSIDGAFILEDDFILRDDFKSILELLTVAPKWDLIKLHSQENYNMAELDKYNLVNQYDIVKPYSIPLRTLAYGVTNAGARKLVNRNKRFSRPVDDDMSCFWEKKLNIWCIDPPVVLLNEQMSMDGSITEQLIASNIFPYNNAPRNLRTRVVYAIQKWHLRIEKRKWYLCNYLKN